MRESNTVHRHKSRRDAYIGGAIILLAVFLLLPEVISSRIRDGFVYMPGPFAQSSGLFEVDAEITIKASHRLVAQVTLQNKTDQVIRRAWATARLDDSLELLIESPTAVDRLDFHVPWIAVNWVQLLKGLPPRFDLLPQGEPEQLSSGQTTAISIATEKSYAADVYSEEKLMEMLAAPIKVKVWHAGGIEYMLVHPVVKTE